MRRESLEETINRNMTQHLDRFPKLSRDIIKAYKQVHDLNQMPSMRAMQFGGEAILKNNVRQYNCSFVNVSYVRSFQEILFILLSGTGVGFSVQNRHIKTLPLVKAPKEEGTFKVHDSIEGWADALGALMSAYFYGGIRPLFDLTGIREKGSYLVTTGAKAPGPEPLRQMLIKVESLLKPALGRKLTDIEVHDIICLIADCVLSGGIRRAALMSLFDRDSKAMLTCKHGEWWNKHPHRARANNSAVLPRGEVSKDEFKHIYDMCIQSNAGEPGFFWTNNLDWGTNPCAEIGLQTNQFCNLTSTSLTGIKNKKDLHNRIYASALIGTLQASYTDFPYLSDQWRETTEREALLGCSFTGVADAGAISKEDLNEAAKLALDVNEKYAKKLGINISNRVTTLKPEGTASCIIGSSSGIHARHDEYYLRRIRMNKDDALAKYLAETIPNLVEQDLFSPSGVVVTIPQMSPQGSILKSQETASSLFKRTMFFYENWVLPGHRAGDNTHNVSVTISYKPEEIEGLFNDLWDNRLSYAAVSLLPFDGGSYKQAPFESCDKETFDKYELLVSDIDLTKVKELADYTDRLKNVACANGVCELEL
jgi:ribonucleoside-diphosphate reductase alpha chain